MGWGDNWEALVDGSGCPHCAEGRPEETPRKIRVGGSAVTDIYVPRRALVRGYAIVVWRGRHVVELHHLAEEEARQYNADVMRLGRAIEAYFRPVKINYMTAGNIVPHLHTHVTARYRDDPAPGVPLPHGQNVEMPEPQWRADAAGLRDALLTA
ncbi:HIT family protein [Paractinoplanes maris]|uniref:HIT family protein n=1 Tax=Paractinoplanes maris TaxID=1734446 RepID=UPI00202089C4|nr:HIT domain-containing protein [Actinoplanes maris]